MRWWRSCSSWQKSCCRASARPRQLWLDINPPRVYVSIPLLTSCATWMLPSPWLCPWPGERRRARSCRRRGCGVACLVFGGTWALLPVGLLAVEYCRHLNDLAVAVAGLPSRLNRRLRHSPAAADAAATRTWAAALLAHSTAAAAVTAGLATFLTIPALVPRLQQRLVAALDAALRVSSRGIEAFCSCGLQGLQGLQGPQRPEEADSVVRDSFTGAIQSHSHLLLDSLFALAGLKGGHSAPSTVAGPLAPAAVHGHLCCLVPAIEFGLAIPHGLETEGEHGNSVARFLWTQLVL